MGLFLGFNVLTISIKMCRRFNMSQKLFLRDKILMYLSPLFGGNHFWAAKRRPYIVFTFTGSVRNVRNDVNIYIYIYVNNMADVKSVQNLLAIFR